MAGRVAKWAVTGLLRTGLILGLLLRVQLTTVKDQSMMPQITCECRNVEKQKIRVDEIDFGTGPWCIFLFAGMKITKLLAYVFGKISFEREWAACIVDLRLWLCTLNLCNFRTMSFFFLAILLLKWWVEANCLFSCFFFCPQPWQRVPS